MKRVAVVIDRQYIDAHFCFRELIISLAGSGFRVTLFYIPTERSPQLNNIENVDLKPFSKSIFGTLKLMLKLLWGNFTYHTIIATPQWPLYWAAKMKIKKGFKLICLSDEVNTIDPDQYSSAQKAQGKTAEKWKQREIDAHQCCDATIALDEIRYQLVKQINGLKENHTHFIIPNAPSYSLTEKPKNHFYRTVFHLNKNETILIHSGGLQWSLLNELNNVQLNQDVKLVLQTRMKGKEKFTSSPILVSDQYIDYENMVAYTKGADIALLLYDENNPEEKRNGNTAGKLGLYLGAGLPIIGCNLKIFKWLEAENCGIRINNLSQLNDAVKQIKENYSAYSANSKRVFESNYEYMKHFKALEDWLKSKK